MAVEYEKQNGCRVRVYVACVCVFFLCHFFFFLVDLFLFMDGSGSVANDNNAWFSWIYVYIAVCQCQCQRVREKSITSLIQYMNPWRFLLFYHLPFFHFRNGGVHDDDKDARVQVRFFGYFYSYFYACAWKPSYFFFSFFIALKWRGQMGTMNQERESKETRDSRIKRWWMGRQVW